MYIETKYNIGDTLWHMVDNKPTELEIMEIDIKVFKSQNKRIDYITYVNPSSLYRKIVIKEENAINSKFKLRDTLFANLFEK